MLVVTVSRVILLALPRLVIWPIIAAWFDPKPISRNRKKRTAEGCNIDRHFQAYVTRIRPRVLPVGVLSPTAATRWAHRLARDDRGDSSLAARRTGTSTTGKSLFVDVSRRRLVNYDRQETKINDDGENGRHESCGELVGQDGTWSWWR